MHDKLAKPNGRTIESDIDRLKAFGMTRDFTKDIQGTHIDAHRTSMAQIQQQYKEHKHPNPNAKVNLNNSYDRISNGGSTRQGARIDPNMYSVPKIDNSQFIPNSEGYNPQRAESKLQYYR